MMPLIMYSITKMAGIILEVLFLLALLVAIILRMVVMVLLAAPDQAPKNK